MAIPPIDAELSIDDLDAVMAALEIIRQKLPFLVGLSPDERRQLSKIGRKSQTFVVKALDMAAKHGDLMPRYFNIEEARRDLELFETLNPVLQSLNQLKELVEDTQMVVGSEAYAAARLAYNTAKASGKNRGLDEVVSDLAQQFRKTRKTQATSD
jgi:hypothetical protein